MKARYDVAGATWQVAPLRREGGVDILVEGRRLSVDMRDLGAAEHLLTIDGKTRRIFVARSGDTVFVQMDGRTHTVLCVPETARLGAGGASEDELTAPMPGTVVAIEVAAGDQVERGDVLVVIESMKLETSVRAPRNGQVASVHVDVGSTFDKGGVLVTLEPEGETAPTDLSA